MILYSKCIFRFNLKYLKSLLSRDTRRSDPSNGRLRGEAAEPGDGGHGGGNSGEVGPTESVKENCDKCCLEVFIFHRVETVSH